MKNIVSKMLLTFFFLAILAVVFMQVIPEVFFVKAVKFENNYRWKKARRFYEIAGMINPLCAKYPSALGKLFLKQAKNRKEGNPWHRNAENMLKLSCGLDPLYAFYRYDLGSFYLSRYKTAKEEDKKGLFSKAMGSFHKAVESDPFNFRINYFIGYDLFSVWDDLDNDAKEFAVERLKTALRARKGYEDNVYGFVYFYSGDFDVLREVTPDNYGSQKGLYMFLQEHDLWQYRREQRSIVEDYLKKEDPERFQKERDEEAKRIEKIKKTFNNDIDVTCLVTQEQWRGKTFDEKHDYENGRMYWNGSLYTVLNMAPGTAELAIKMKKFLVLPVEDTNAPGLFPYVVVKLDNEEIGGMFIDNDEWKEYRFSVRTDGGMKVLSIDFLNDVYCVKRGEDRNVIVGETVISYK